MVKFSIITINYNNRDGLLFTLQSVFSQLYHNIQMIVIDGASSDGSVDIIRRYEENIDYWVSEPDRGVYDAMNKAIDIADGGYCIFMNSGDRFHSDDVLVITSRGCHADVVVGKTNVFEIVDGEMLSRCLFDVPDKMSARHLIQYGVNHQSCFIKTELLKNNKYDDTLRFVSDWKFFLQELVLKNRSYQRLPIIVADYDFSGISSQNANKDKLELEKELVLSQILPQRIIDDYKYMMGGTDLLRVLNSVDESSKLYQVLTFTALFLRKIQLQLSKIIRSFK